MNGILRKLSVLCLVLVLAGAAWAGCTKDGSACKKGDETKACDKKEKKDCDKKAECDKTQQKECEKSADKQ